MFSESVRYSFYQPLDEKIKTWTLRFSAKENPNNREGIVRLANCVAVWRQSEVRLISRKFSFMKFFQPSVRLTNQKQRGFVSVR